MGQFFEIDRNGCYTLILYPRICLHGNSQVSSTIQFKFSHFRIIFRGGQNLLGYRVGQNCNRDFFTNQKQQGHDFFIKQNNRVATFFGSWNNRITKCLVAEKLIFPVPSLYTLTNPLLWSPTFMQSSKKSVL